MRANKPRSCRLTAGLLSCDVVAAGAGEFRAASQVLKYSANLPDTSLCLFWIAWQNYAKLHHWIIRRKDIGKSYQEKISATYQFLNVRRRAMFVFRVLQCTTRFRPRLVNWSKKAGGLKSMDWRTKDICIDEQHMQKRKQYIPYVNWTYQQTLARIRSAVSPSSSGECCSCFERFSARSFQKNNLFQDQFLLIPPGVQVLMAPDLCQVSRRQCVWFLNSKQSMLYFQKSLTVMHLWSPNTPYRNFYC
jgi:hypothetical protein